MKAILSLRKHSYLKTFGVFLIAVALIAGVVGCEGEGEREYDLVVDSTDGGVVTHPGEGTFTIDAGTIVGLNASPDCGFAFDVWSGDTEAIDDINAAFTGLQMNADYSITANFKPIPPDHYKFYQVNWEGEPIPIGKEVVLEDQFGTFEATVEDAMFFGNPVEKEHDGVKPIKDPNRHYTVYRLDSWWTEDEWVTRNVEVSNQFQDKVELTVMGPIALAVPTQKEGHEMVECINHYLLYWVSEGDWMEFSPVEGVNLKDQFIPDGEDVTVQGPYLFANPVKKTVVGGTVSAIEDDELHWVLYDIWQFDSPSIDKRIQIENQFDLEPQTLDLTYRDVLAVPSVKNVPPTPPLDHFKCYTATGPATGVEGVWVGLVAQFHAYYFDGFVMDPLMFCNPVDKVHAGGPTTNRNDDQHLTVYKLGADIYWYTVTVDNQFGDDQVLIVKGPVALAVPTQKVDPGDHGMPKYIDHYLLYEVVEGLNVNTAVDLDDQFEGTAPGVEVTWPVYFATPAIKGYLDYEPGFWDPEGHLLFYEISPNDEFLPLVLIKNQFFPEEPVPLNLFDNWELLAVPSVKVDWAFYD